MDYHKIVPDTVLYKQCQCWKKNLSASVDYAESVFICWIVIMNWHFMGQFLSNMDFIELFLPAELWVIFWFHQNLIWKGLLVWAIIIYKVVFFFIWQILGLVLDMLLLLFVFTHPLIPVCQSNQWIGWVKKGPPLLQPSDLAKMSGIRTEMCYRTADSINFPYFKPKNVWLWDLPICLKTCHQYTKPKQISLAIVGFFINFFSYTYVYFLRVAQTLIYLNYVHYLLVGQTHCVFQVLWDSLVAVWQNYVCFIHIYLILTFKTFLGIFLLNWPQQSLPFVADSCLSLGW